jgi:cytochrome c oxidase subunit 2
MKKAIALLGGLLMAACSRNPSSVVDTAGPHAAITAKLFWFFLAANSLIWLLVMGFLLFALWRQRAQSLGELLQPSPQSERRLLIGVSVCVGLTVIVLTSYLGISYAVDKKLIGFDKDPAMEIELTGRQWWWDVRYPGYVPSDTFTTANEIHVPVGMKVRLVLRSDDVIHSVWLPNLAGKRDIIPGHDQDLIIRADKEGIWRGRCAEFCGLQHANMGLTVFAETKEKFEAWQKAQRLPAPQPITLQEKQGRDIFTKNTCAMCHVIRVTDSTGYSSNAPDLTHLQSRTTLGAGAAPNTEEYLSSWIQDPHNAKPGVHMPTIAQDPAEYKALVAYLETLK